MPTEKPNLFSREITDIFMTKGRHRTFVRGDSVRGHAWINDNMVDVREGSVLIDNEGADDVEKKILQSGLVVTRRGT